MATTLEPRLSLDRRQRAMLKEMGVLVWQPVPVASAAPVAPVASVAPVGIGTAVISVAKLATTAKPAGNSTQASTSTPTTHLQSASSVVAPYSGAASPYKTRATDTIISENQSNEALHGSEGTRTWRVGKLQALYGQTDLPQGKRWLVLMESPVSALQDAHNPLEGDTGRLLDNMLRASQRHTAGTTLFAPLVRGQGAGGDLNADVADIFASAQADLVLVMGRLAAQALLQSNEPLAKLRGHVQTLHRTQTVVVLEPAYLLRNPMDKAKAWDDLCLALHTQAA